MKIKLFGREFRNVIPHGSYNGFCVLFCLLIMPTIVSYTLLFKIMFYAMIINLIIFWVKYNFRRVYRGESD